MVGIEVLVIVMDVPTGAGIESVVIWAALTMVKPFTTTVSVEPVLTK